MNKFTISPSLMCLDWLRAEDQIIELQKSKLVDYFHVDIIDGKFAPDFTMGSSIINSLLKVIQLPLDYHLMTYEPNDYIDSFPVTKGSYFSIHQESTRNLHRDLITIKNKGYKVGVALSPGTSLDTLEYVIEDIDMVIVMTVNPGYLGQPLVPQAIKKIQKLKKLIKDMNLDVKVSVDGNVNLKTLPDMLMAGADHAVLGSSGLFREKNLTEQLKNIKKTVEKYK
jgi:ribulose-phosphate 3-epimerase